MFLISKIKGKEKCEYNMVEKILIETVNVEYMGVKGIDEFELEYYLTNTEDGIYGVEIVKKQANKENETKHIIDIVRNKENTMKILECLARNQVTPTTFEYVIEDYWGMYA